MNDLVVNAGNFIVGAIGAAFQHLRPVAGCAVRSTQRPNHGVPYPRGLLPCAGGWPLRFHETFVSGQGTGLSLDLMAAMSSTAWGSPRLHVGGD